MKVVSMRASFIISLSAVCMTFCISDTVRLVKNDELSDKGGNKAITNISNSHGSSVIDSDVTLKNPSLRGNSIQIEKHLKWMDVVQRSKEAAFRGGLYAASAGLIQVVSLMWLRTTVNYQYRYGVPMIKALKELYLQGGVMRFYKGITYAIVLGPVCKFGATAANEGSRVLMDSYDLSSTTAQLYTTVLGTGLNALWRFLLMPLETCKTVLQVDGSIGFQRLISKVLRGNFSVLYQGSAASLLVSAVSHYPWFYVYNFLDETMKKSTDLVDTIIRSAFIGFMASAASDIISNGLRIIKTIKQSTISDSVKGVSYLAIINNLYREGGWPALLVRGLGTRLFTNGIQSVIFTVLWKVLPIYWK